MKTHSLAHLIKSEDLNHHGTLYAGRMAEWFVEASFIAAASLYGHPENIVCVKMHGLKFGKPASKGDIIHIETSAVAAGTTSFTVYGKVKRGNSEEVLVDGYVTFVCVDLEGKKMAHNLVIPPATNEEERRVQEIAKTLR